MRNANSISAINWRVCKIFLLVTNEKVRYISGMKNLSKSEEKGHKFIGAMYLVNCEIFLKYLLFLRMYPYKEWPRTVKYPQNISIDSKNLKTKRKLNLHLKETKIIHKNYFSYVTKRFKIKKDKSTVINIHGIEFQ